MEQMDELRAEIDRVSQERAQSLQELQQERTHSRQRHQQLVDSITAALQSRDASLGALHRLEQFCSDQMGLDISGLAIYEVRAVAAAASSLPPLPSVDPSPLPSHLLPSISSPPSLPSHLLTHPSHLLPPIQ